MVTDMFNRYACQEREREGRVLTTRNSLSQSCSKKCIPPSYAEGELTKGESVCLDRCVAKFFDINVKVPSSFILRGLSQPTEAHTLDERMLTSWRAVGIGANAEHAGTSARRGWCRWFRRFRWLKRLLDYRGRTRDCNTIYSTIGQKRTGVATGAEDKSVVNDICTLCNYLEHTIIRSCLVATIHQRNMIEL